MRTRRRKTYRPTAVGRSRPRPRSKPNKHRSNVSSDDPLLNFTVSEDGIIQGKGKLSGRVVKRYSESRKLRAGASKKSERYQQRHPYPSYGQFGKAEFVDSQGVQYRIADGADAEDAFQIGINANIWKPEEGLGVKSQLLYVRIPKSSKFQYQEVMIGRNLILEHINSKNVFQGRISQIRGLEERGRRTGSIVVTKVYPID